MGPSGKTLPSPKSTWTFRICVVEFAAGVTVRLNVIGVPAVRVPVVTGLIVTVGIGLTFTITLPDACVEVDPPAPGVVPVPVDGGVVVDVPATPAVAVTVA